MDYKRLGRSGLQVSRLCLGTNNFGGQVTERDSIAIINRAIDLGINTIDTANTYTKGSSEKIIGKAMRGRREDIILATKVGMTIGQGPNQGGLSRKHILSQIRQSLENMQTDFVDIYYLHRWDPNTPLEETLKTLNDLVREGKIGYIACSNFTALQIAEVQGMCEAHDWERLIAVQPPYNLLQRDVERDLLPYCKQEGIGILTYTPLMGGFLAGKYSRDKPPPKGSRAEYNSQYLERINNENKYPALEKIVEISNEVGIPIHKLAIAWILRNSEVTAPIVGASRLKQVEENCEIIEIKLTDEIYDKLNDVTKSL